MSVPRFLTAGGLVLLVSGCTRESPVAPSPQVASEQDATGGATQPTSTDPRTYWRGRSDSALWAAIKSGGVALVGLRTPGHDRGVVRGKALVSKMERLGRASAIGNIPGLTVLEHDERLPILRVRVRDQTSLVALRQLSFVDYIEPQFDTSTPASRFFQGACEGNAFGGYTGTLAPLNDIYGWNLEGHSIPQAWNVSSGAGIMIGLVDTGIDPAQPQLGSQFFDGMSNIGGRALLTTWRIGSNADDSCGHGTHMAGVLAAPRDGRNVVGIAWGAGLYVAKVNNDPWANFMDANAVRLGIGDVAGISQIIVMAFGDVFGHASIEDEISYWYYNYDRLFVGAGGNFPDWCSGVGGDCQPGVLFPARLETVTAVTGQQFTCGDCIYGPEIDFATTPPTATTGATALGHPDVGTSSQSSGATAEFGGIAALVWSAYPYWSRDQVLERLRLCSTNATYRSSTIGWGLTSAYCGVGGVELLVGISGPLDLARYQSAQYTASVSWRVTAPTAPYNYQWRTRDTGPYGTGPWSGWYTTGTQNYTFMSVNSCGITRKEIQARVTDANGVVGESSGYPVGVTNPR